MLNGIDISSHQGDIDLSKLSIDFAIVKATEGTGYVNPYCDPKVQQLLKLGKLFGFYHYGRNNDATKEADYFISNTKGYEGEGIPVLDWEEDQSVSWVNTFVRRYHDVTGVWPWIYGNPWRFNQGGVESNCGRWVAQYPNYTNPNFSSISPNNAPEADGLVCAWQFASDGRISGYNSNLDLDFFFGDKNAWKAYARGNSSDNNSNATTDNNSNGNNENNTGSDSDMDTVGNNVSVLENDEFEVTIKEK